MHLAYPDSLQALHSKTDLKLIMHNRTEKDLKPQLAGVIQLAFYKRGGGFEPGTTENISSKWPERDG